MEEKEIMQRISSDPNICHGKPCIKGTRIPVYLVVFLVAEGESIENIIKEYNPDKTYLNENRLFA